MDLTYVLAPPPSVPYPACVSRPDRIFPHPPVAHPDRGQAFLGTLRLTQLKGQWVVQYH